jgi:hypothetical protein
MPGIRLGGPVRTPRLEMTEGAKRQLHADLETTGLSVKAAADTAKSAGWQVDFYPFNPSAAGCGGIEGGSIPLSGLQFPHIVLHLQGLGVQFLGGRCRFLRVRGILLNRLVHILDGCVYLFYPLGPLV